MVGTVTGNTLHLDYDRTPILYTGVFDGTIGDNVITAGTFSDSDGNHLSWTATGTSVRDYACYWNYFTKIVAAPADAYRLWDVSGDWVLEFDYFGSLYIHDMIVDNNVFTGTGGYPSGGPYTTTWTVKGTIDGDNIEMTINYDGSSYYSEVIGTIAENGTMSGNWSNPTQKGTWIKYIW